MENFVKEDEKSRISVNNKELESLKSTLTQVASLETKFKSGELTGQEALESTNAIINFHNSKVSLLNQMRSKKIEIRELTSKQEEE